MKARISIGSAIDNDIVIPDPSLSPHHAEIIRENGSWNWSVYKLLPQGIVSVNGLDVQRVVVKNGDEISLEPIVENDDEILDAGCVFRFWGRTDIRDVAQSNLTVSLSQYPNASSSTKDLHKISMGGLLNPIYFFGIGIKKRSTPIDQMIKEQQLLEKAQRFFKAKQYEDAIAAYSQIIQLIPEDSVTYVSRGLAYHRLGEYRKAIVDYNKAIELAPKNAAAYAYRGLAYHWLEEYQKAISDYDQTLTIDPSFEHVWENRKIAQTALAQKEEK